LPSNDGRIYYSEIGDPNPSLDGRENAFFVSLHGAPGGKYVGHVTALNVGIHRSNMMRILEADLGVKNFNPRDVITLLGLSDWWGGVSYRKDGPNSSNDQVFIMPDYVWYISLEVPHPSKDKEVEVIKQKLAALTAQGS
jgi:hypothetical protein